MTGRLLVGLRWWEETNDSGPKPTHRGAVHTIGPAYRPVASLPPAPPHTRRLLSISLDAKGDSVWRFESLDPERLKAISPEDSRVFWWALYATVRERVPALAPAASAQGA